MCQSMNVSDLPPGLQDPPLLLASFAPSGELIVAGTDDKSTEVTVQHSTTRGGGLRLLLLHFPLQVLVWPKIKTTHSLPAKPLLRFDGGKASTSLTPPATVLASLISWLIGHCHRPSGWTVLHLQSGSVPCGHTPSAGCQCPARHSVQGSRQQGDLPLGLHHREAPQDTGCR